MLYFESILENILQILTFDFTFFVPKKKRKEKLKLAMYKFKFKVLCFVEAFVPKTIFDVIASLRIVFDSPLMSFVLSLYDI